MNTYNNSSPKNWAIVNSDVAEIDEEQVVNQGDPQANPGEEQDKEQQRQKKEKQEEEEEEREFDEEDDFEQIDDDDGDDLSAP